MGLFSRKKKDEQTIKENPYPGLREMAFNVKPEDLGLNPSENQLYGVVMDWNMGNGVITLVSFITGDTSLYISSGAGFIGAGQHDDVNQLVQQFVVESSAQLETASLDESRELPTGGEIFFHFLSSTGKAVKRDHIEGMENRTSANLAYFEAANQVISAIRIASERN